METSIEKIKARVTAQYKGLYRVKADSNETEYMAKITGKRIFNAETKEDFPVVGDWVMIKVISDDEAVIEEILPRTTLLKKKNTNQIDSQMIAANIDTAFIIESIDRDFNLNRFERYLVLVREANIKPVIILNKIDLIEGYELEMMIDQIVARFTDIDIIPTSTVLDQGLDELRKFIEKDKTYCFLGSSGVGKSSLINKLLNKDEIETKEVSSSTGRGKHTTTAREMYFLDNGGIVIDNPGMREVGVGDVENGIGDVFSEIESYSGQCKFSDCTHTHEPGCAVQNAIKEEMLDESKFANYKKLKKENDFYKMTSLEKREKDKKFGKYVKKVKREMGI